MLGHGGLGLISTSNFYVPQVNLPGSMAAFVRPAAIPSFVDPAAPNAIPKHGLGDIAPDILSGLDFTPVYLAAAAPYLIGGAVLLILLSTRK
jgi:hypothetical protein